MKKLDVAERLGIVIFFFGLVIGGLIGGAAALHVCTVKTEKALAERDARMRSLIYESFALDPLQQESANGENIYILIVAAGGAYRAAAADATLCHAQLGVRPPDPAAAPAPASASADPTVDLLNAIRPGLGTAMKKLSQASPR